MGNDHVTCGQRFKRLEKEMQKIKMNIRQLQAICGRLESRMASFYDQMRQVMTMFQKNGQSLPINTENNPRKNEKEHLPVRMIEQQNVLVIIKCYEHVPKAIDESTKREEAEHHELAEEVAELVSDPIIGRPSTTNVSFSTRLEDKQKKDKVNFLSFLNLFKSPNDSLPLLEIIDKIPKYVNALIAKRIPPILKDLGSFTIPIEIGDRHFTKALCDLGVA
ncbi:gag-asp_proteas domain-containing protein [Gossypium australe]|uniref:Gag-asp_proteas domain-containing protein n=1 Tax=Gossypium australe TaxID=47621 RepID=A0A5B6WRR9_9ROSI|nr:gag-asp_proteas domain-containing protein [Gossypium australe]